MTDIGIVGAGAYVPYWRLKRSTIADAWNIPTMAGERAAASADEDSLTMATEAALVASQHVDPKEIDGVIFASTTSPYREKQSATAVATVLDCRKDVFTLDVANTLRGATTAIRVAVDAIGSGSARAVLVCAADARLGEPQTSQEMILGDAAGSILLASAKWATDHGFEDLMVVMEEMCGVSMESLGPWRRENDRFVRSFEPKIEVKYGMEQALEAGHTLLEQVTASAEDIDRAIISAPDPRSQKGVANALGLGGALLQDLCFGDIGNMGTATPLVMLVGALEAAAPGERMLLIGVGDGADALLLRSTDELSRVRGEGRWGMLTPYRESKAYLPSYAIYAGRRKLIARETNDVWSSSVTYWRDLPMELPFYGMTCRSCGTVQYPVGKRCMECAAPGPHETGPLTRKGKIFTFTLDHLVQGEYRNEPIPRAVIELEGGGRVFCELTDCDPDEVHIEMPVELTFRCLHEGANFRNYYWKGRPLRDRAHEMVN